MTVVYDGEFESFLTLVYEYYYKKLKIDLITKEMPDSLFLDDVFEVKYNEEKSHKVLNALRVKFKKCYFENVLNVFMCDTIEFETDLLNYIVLGFKDQKQLENINIECVFNIKAYLKELFSLYHKMSGFVRFEELEDKTLYAKIDIRFNILYFLAKHFNKRFNNQNFIIHDLKRELAYIHIDGNRSIQKVAHFEEPKRSDDEEKFQNLWRTFFKSVSIQSRQNKKLQQQFVPLIYRTYMSEFID
jgi:probable DNA metabolism protein